MTTPYTELAAEFAEQTGIDDPDAQFLALVEEVGELAETLNRDEDPGEEIADVLVTAFVLAETVDVDAETAYEEKMAYNLVKSAEKQGGKVTDDGGRDD